MKITEHRTRWGLSRSFRSRWNYVDAVCRDIGTLLKEHGLASRSFKLELLARECLNNAVRHGNGRDETKQVTVRLSCGHKWIRLQVADEGPGFNWRQARGNSLPEQSSTSGRGLPIIFSFASRVRFNRQGNQITLWVCTTE